MFNKIYNKFNRLQFMHFEIVRLTEISNDDKGKSIAMHFTLIRVCCFIALWIDNLSLSPSCNSYGRPMEFVNNIYAEYKAQRKQNEKNKRDISPHATISIMKERISRKRMRDLRRLTKSASRD